MFLSEFKLAVFVFIALFLTGSVATAEQKAHVGIVIETETVGNYTYIKLDEDGSEVWLAAQPMNVSVGDKVEYIGGIGMRNFQSKSLGRTFESILLITQIKVLGDDTENSETETTDADSDSDDSLPEMPETVAAPKIGEIKKAENGKTVQEIFSEWEQLKDREIILRAKVIKVNPNILGKSWITLSDGTGVKPDNKIIATTSNEVNLGEILTVKGVVKNNVDIGQGYKYKVMIGNAEFIK